jgi:predicted RNase H-like nuclease (RuvC/YqgF family)
MTKKNLIVEQYNVESSLGDQSPLSTGSDNVTKNPQDYDLVRSMQRQIDKLQQELRRLHNRHRELHNEVERLRSNMR